jgi:hypothetical protein
MNVKIKNVDNGYILEYGIASIYVFKTFPELLQFMNDRLASYFIQIGAKTEIKIKQKD